MEPTLHPNLAKLAAAYDEILERYNRGQINAAQARAEIIALETRDDQGVRWTLDPDTGAWTRRTALGGSQVDAPPQWGYGTPDAYDFTREPAGFNPGDRISQHQVDESLMYAPAGLAGATRNLPEAAEDDGWRELLARIPTVWKVAAVAVAAAVSLLTFGDMSSATSSTHVPPATSTTPAAPTHR